MHWTAEKPSFLRLLNAAAFPARPGTVSVLLLKSHGTFSPNPQFLLPLPKQLYPQTAAGTHLQCRFPVHGCRGIPFWAQLPALWFLSHTPSGVLSAHRLPLSCRRTGSFFSRDTLSFHSYVYLPGFHINQKYNSDTSFIILSVRKIFHTTRILPDFSPQFHVFFPDFLSFFLHPDCLSNQIVETCFVLLSVRKNPARRAFYFIGKFNEVSGNAKKIPLYRFCPQQGNSLHLTVFCEL